MKRISSPEFWPDHLRAVFIAIGKAMNERCLHPDVLRDLPTGAGAIIPDHDVAVKHHSGEAANPGGNRYEISIDGPRIVAGWTFRSGELENLSRESYSRSLGREDG